MDLTVSYQDQFPSDVLARYEFEETRNASAILSATNPNAHNALIGVLRDFELLSNDLLSKGGAKSALARRLDESFRACGWREAQVNTLIRLQLKKMPYRPAGEAHPQVVDTETQNDGYKVDNFVDRVALDVEWNAKDGNLDRDISAYRALYDAGLIDVGVIVTRTSDDLKALAQRLAHDAGLSIEAGRKILGTSTTTNIEKLRPRMSRGDSGGCPLLAIMICARTWRASGP